MDVDLRGVDRFVAEERLLAQRGLALHVLRHTVAIRLLNAAVATTVIAFCGAAGDGDVGRGGAR